MTRAALHAACALALLAWASAPPDAAAERWRGLEVAPEHRCSPYRSEDYRYPQSVERGIARDLGGIWSPYTGRCFSSLRETDIEHIVARSEAHDSGLCAASAETRKRFARDPLNLTLASPGLNRREKKAHDAHGWTPARNRCWFAARVVEVRRMYGLSVDRREAEALEGILSACTSTGLGPVDCAAAAAAAAAPAARTRARGAAPEGDEGALARWDDNGNGRITCAEARRHGIAPVHADHPAYPWMRDGDGDGVVCE